MSKLVRLLSSLAIAVVALVALAPRALAAVSVVATTPDLAAIAREVGGPGVEVVALSLPTQDPHFVDARPNLALALNRADLLVVQGLELEVGWLPALQAGAKNPKIQAGAAGFLDASTLVAVQEAPAGEVSRAQGDIHRAGNPHYLVDPRNGAKVGRGLAAKLAALDPAGAAGYRDRADALEKQAADLAAKQAARFAALDAGKRKVVVYHRSWSYLEAWLGVTEVGAVEPKPGIPPDPAHVAGLLGTMRAQGARAVVSESYYPTTTSKLLADKSGAALCVLDGGAADGQRYLDHLRDDADRLFTALSR
jgi:zinc/manganese transport system substrate-binding protein